MNWFNVLKAPYGMFPDADEVLYLDLISSENFQEFLENIQSGKFSKENLSKLKNRLDQLKVDDAKIQRAYDLYGKLPQADQTKEQFKANIEQIIEFLPKKQAPEKSQQIKLLVEQIQGSDFSEKKKLIAKLIELMPKNRGKWRRYPEAKKIIQYQEYINRRKSKNMIPFDTTPSESDSEVTEFVKLLESKFENGIIELNVSTHGEFISLLNPIIYSDKNKSNWEIKRIQNPENREEIIDVIAEGKKDLVKNKKKIKNLYNTLNKKYKINVIFAGKNKNKETKEDLGSKMAFLGTKYKIAPAHTPFTAKSVELYIKAYEDVIGEPGQLIPSWISGKNPDNSDYNQTTIGRNPTGTILPFPDNLFLQRATKNMKKIVLNPYGSAILYHSMRKNWFETYLKMAKQTEFISEDRAEKMIIDDLYSSLSGVHGDIQRSFAYDIPLNPYKKTLKGKNIDFNDADFARKKIKENIRNNSSRKNEVKSVTSQMRRDTLFNLDRGWTKSEALRFLEFWNEGEYEGAEGKVRVNWYSSPISPRPLIQEDFASEQNMIDAASFARIEIAWVIEETIEYDDDYNIASAEYEDYKTFTPLETAEKLGESFEKQKERRKRNYDKITQKKKEQNDKLRELLNTDISSARKDEIRNTIAQREANIERFEDVENKEKQRTKSAIGAVRNLSSSAKDFVSFLVDLSKERKDEGGLSSLADEIKNDFNKLSILNPKDAAGFLSYLASFYPDDKDFIQTAYESIDNRPDDAKSIAEKLDKKMSKFLQEMKELVVKAFENQLKNFTLHMFTYDKNKIANIVNVFEKAGLIEEV